MRQRVYKSDNFVYQPIYYLKIWLFVVKKSISKNMVYRIDFASKIVRLFMVLFIQIVLVQSLFSQSDDIGGWSIDQYYLLIGTYNFVNYISWGIFNVNLFRLSEKLVKGEYDYLLLSPSGSIFSASFNEFFLDDIISSISGVFLIGYFIIVNWGDISVTNFIAYIILLFTGIIIWYSIHLVASSTNFLTPRNGVMELTKAFSRAGSYPINIFNDTLKILFYSVFPIAFVAVVPANVLSGSVGFQFVVYSILVAIGGLFIGKTIWNFNLRWYVGAGG